MKLLLGLLSAVLLSGGFLATAPAATAAPYPNTIATYCAANGGPKAVNVRVRAASNHAPRGVASIKIRKAGHVVRTATVRFDGGDYSHKRFAHRLRKGRYTVTVKANPSNDAYKNCSHSFRMRVR